MKNEIKEILKDYKKLAREIIEKLDNTVEYENWLIIQDHFDNLLYYITNLQRENKKLNNIIDKTKENINDDIYLLKTGVKRNFKHISITEAISILEMILIQINN